MKRAFVAVLLAAGTLTVAAGSLVPAHAAVTAMTALINGDSVTTVDGITKSGTPISLEQFAAEQLGYTVTVVSGATWDGMTAAQFATYQLLIVGDPDCGSTPASATSNAATWAPVVMGAGPNTAVGNRVVIGTDPEFHYISGGGGASPTNPSDPTTAGAEHLVQDGMSFAGAVSGATGVYFDTSCSDPGSDVSVLNSLSSAGTGFTEDSSPPCGGSVQLIASNPAFTSLTDANIQGWGCSDHITFPAFPTDWQPLAVATDTASHPTCGTDPSTGTTACGEAYVLLAGNGLVVTAPNLTLTPATHSDPAGGSHTVTATVTQSGSPVSGALVSFVITGQNAGVSGTCVPTSCDTDASGMVTFTYPDTHGAGMDTIDASVTLSGTTEHATASETWTTASPTSTTLTVKSATGDFADPATVSAVLTNTSTASPVSGKPVTLTLNGAENCMATTDATGTAICSITPGEAAGTYTLAGAFAGDTSFAASSGSASFAVTLEQTGLSYTGATSGINGQPVTLSGMLTTDDPSAGTALAGKTVTFTLGSGGTAQTCSGTTDATGNASCTIASVSQTVGSVPISASYAGDTFYLPASASSTMSVFAPPATGAFVIGDLSAGGPTVGNLVDFWDAQWAKDNNLSGGSAPSSMKGFANSPTALTCGSTWTTTTGNSSAPPATLPGRINVIVSSKVTQSGSKISGNIVHIVTVQVNPGYANDPGHRGTGSIVGIIC